MCADCPNTCAGEDTVCQVLSPDGMDSQTKQDFDQRDVGICKKGCGLLLPREVIAKGNHCCLDALRMFTDALEERSSTLEHEARLARLRWGRREQALLAHVSTLQSEAQLAAVKYQKKLHQYMLNINSISEQVIGYYKVRVMHCCIV